MSMLRSLFLFLALCAVAVGIEPNQTIKIPMRDGVQLETDLYFPPNGEKEGLPCILIRSPAGRQAPFAKYFANLSAYDYLVALQDTRSVSDPDKKIMPYMHDHDDGIDTIKWLAASKLTNGKIGTAGASALGIVQYLMAPGAPDSLVAQYIRVAAPSLYTHAMFGNGRFCKEKVESWLKAYASQDVLDFIKNRPDYDDFWKQFNSLEFDQEIHTPALHLGGWYDIFIQGTIDGFAARQENGGVGAKGAQKLVIGPWGHYWPKDLSLGDFEVPANAQQLPEHLTEKGWFDYYLKGKKDSALKDTPAVTYYVMGPFDGSPSKGGRWKTSSVWPIPARTEAFYLHANGLLDKTLPAAAESLPIIHDAKNPTPTVGGRNLFISSGPKDQRELEARKDVLVFTTAPLAADLEVTGTVSTKLFIRISGQEGDIAVRLCDVYPDGRSILITDGLSIIPEGEKDSVKEVKVDLSPTSMVFAKGHKIRISLASANYPCFDTQTSPEADRRTESLLFTANQQPQLQLPVVD